MSFFLSTVSADKVYPPLSGGMDKLKYCYDEIIGESPRLIESLKLLDRVTDNHTPVFLFGESGTGKELMARAIHFNGPRAKKPFVPVNCSAIPEPLLEAELFGYARGAFTGAEQSHDGILATAHGGTLFLDEIGDMPLTMQAKLLRSLEDKTIKPLGSKNEMCVDIRLITASNKDLKELVREKKFREDLFFRIHKVRVILPPLRERKEDLPLLIQHFLEKLAKEKQIPKKVLSPQAFELLAAYSWPGNIRELESVLESASLLAEGPEIKPEDLRQKEEFFVERLTKKESLDAKPSLDIALKEYEELMIQKMLQLCQGNLSQVARNLKITRPRLYRLIKKLDIQM